MRFLYFSFVKMARVGRFAILTLTLTHTHTHTHFGALKVGPEGIQLRVLATLPPNAAAFIPALFPVT